MAVNADRHKNLEIPTPAGSLHSAPSLDGDNMFASIIDYSKASLGLANQGWLSSMCIGSPFQGLELKQQGGKAGNNLILTSLFYTV